MRSWSCGGTGIDPPPLLQKLISERKDSMKPTYRRLIGAAACAALIALLPADMCIRDRYNSDRGAAKTGRQTRACRGGFASPHFIHLSLIHIWWRATSPSATSLCPRWRPGISPGGRRRTNSSSKCQRAMTPLWGKEAWAFPAARSSVSPWPAPWRWSPPCLLYTSRCV